jgi:hypothetical protein
LTIAKAIQKKMDCILVDNHLINNVIFSLIDPDGKTKLPDKIWDNVHQVRSAVFDTIRNLAKPGRTFVFTNELLEGEERHSKVFAEIASLALARNALFVPVRLAISPEELSRRVVSPGRAEQFKEIDPEASLTKAQKRQVLRLQGFNPLEIDVTTTPPEDVAEQIIVALRSRQSA